MLVTSGSGAKGREAMITKGDYQNIATERQKLLEHQYDQGREGNYYHDININIILHRFDRQHY